MADRLTRGALNAINIHSVTGLPAEFREPILQAIQLKQLTAAPPGQVRYRVIVNDGVNFTQAMLATQNNHLVDEGKLQKGCFFRLTNYSTNMVKERKIIILLGLDVLEDAGLGDKVGESVPVGPPPAQEQQAQTSAAPSGPGPTNGSSFYGAKDTKPAQQRSSTFAAHTNIYPIEGLSPYQNKWTIKARVTLKSEIKHYHNQRGEGKLFTVHFLDQSGEIRATGFNERVDDLYDKLEEGEVYYVSKCRVNIAKKQFSTIQNEYELMFERDTEVERCNDTDQSVPQVKFDFVPIGNIANVEKDQTIDVIGVLKEVHDVSEITSKATQKPYSKRELVLVDSTGYSIRTTVWGKTAQEFTVDPDSVIAFKGVKVSDFGGRSLSALQSSTLTVNPSIQEAYDLKGWYDGQGRDETFMTHQNAAGSVATATGRQDPRKTLGEIADGNIGLSDQPDYYVCKATIMHIKKDRISYAACPTADCNKKVTEDSEGWRCERCDRTFPKPQYRYIMTVPVQDHTGEAYFSCFDDVGRMIMGCTADELQTLSEENETAYLEKFKDANCKTYVFRCRAKQDNYQNTVRVRHSVMSAAPPNYVQEGRDLLKVIQSYG